MNKNDFPPNTNPNLYSLIAVAIGYAFTTSYNANELNSLGNWLILVGQYTLTYAAQEQLIEARNPHINKCNNNFQNDLDLIKDAINKIQNELNKI